MTIPKCPWYFCVIRRSFVEVLSEHVLKALWVYHRFILIARVSPAIIIKQESASVNSDLIYNSQLSIYYAVVINDAHITAYNNNNLVLIHINMPTALSMDS